MAKKTSKREETPEIRTTGSISDINNALTYAYNSLETLPKTKKIGIAHACVLKALDNLK